jgi:hypothetical protein
MPADQELQFPYKAFMKARVSVNAYLYKVIYRLYKNFIKNYVFIKYSF